MRPASMSLPHAQPSLLTPARVPIFFSFFFFFFFFFFARISYLISKDTFFRIMPRFKVRSEGDTVRYGDQIMLESIKSSGQFIHVGAKKVYFIKNIFDFELVTFSLVKTR